MVTQWTGAIVFVFSINLSAYAKPVASKIDVQNTTKEATNITKIFVTEKILFIR